MDKRIYRSRDNQVFSGVCGGLGEYFNIDPTIIRLLAVFIILSSFMTGIIAYIVCAMVIPQRPLNMPYQYGRKDDECCQRTPDEYASRQSDGQWGNQEPLRSEEEMSIPPVTTVQPKGTYDETLGASDKE